MTVDRFTQNHLLHDQHVVKRNRHPALNKLATAFGIAGVALVVVSGIRFETQYLKNQGAAMDHYSNRETNPVVKHCYDPDAKMDFTITQTDLDARVEGKEIRAVRRARALGCLPH